MILSENIKIWNKEFGHVYMDEGADSPSSFSAIDKIYGDVLALD